MSDKKKPIDLRHLGGRKILEPVPEGPKERIELSHIGGKRIAEHIAPEKAKEDRSKADAGSVKT